MTYQLSYPSPSNTSLLKDEMLLFQYIIPVISMVTNVFPLYKKFVKDAVRDIDLISY